MQPKILFAGLFSIAILSSALAAEDGQQSFIAGLDQLANEKWDDAVTSFQKSVDTDDEKATYHLHLGIAQIMSGNGASAKKSLARASKLEPQNPDVMVWSYARLQMFESSAFGGSPPYRKTTYAPKLVDNAIAYGVPSNQERKDKAYGVIKEIVKEFAWNQLGKQGAPAMIDRVISMYKEKRYQDCLDLINKLRAAGPIDWQMIGYSAHCKLGLGDFQGARDEYTISLKAQPLTAGYLIGRAQCEVNLSALRDASADYELARLIDPELSTKYAGDIEKKINDSGSKISSDSSAVLWQNLKKAATDNAPEEQLISIANQLNRSRGSSRYVKDEEYSRELTRLSINVKNNPQKADPLVDVATFLLDPTVSRKVSLPGVDATARIPVGQANAKRAEPFLGDALKIDSGNLRAMEQTALLYLNYQQFKDMISWVHKALDGGALTLDLCKMHLDYYTNLANNLNNEAAALRTPTVTTHDERQGDMIVTYRTTIPPTAAALARADALDQQAREYRDKSIKPMESLAGKLKGSQNPQDQITYDLANAHYYTWTGKYGESVAAAQAALKIDPYDLDALTFLIDLCPKVGMQEQAVGYQDLLNNLANPSSGRTLDKIWPQLKQTRFKGAREQLAKAEEIDPGSPHIANATFAIAQEQDKLNDALVSGRIVLAMEQARVAASGRSLNDKSKDPLIGSDAIISIYVRTALSKMLDDAGRFDEVLDQSVRAIRLAARTSKSDWKTAVPETIIPNDPGKLGNTIQALYATSNRYAAYKLLAQGKNKEAISHVVALAQMEPPDNQAMNIGYQIYQTTGFKAFQGKVPDGWLMMFEQWDRQRDLDKQFGRSNGETYNAELQSIDQQLDKINREIQHGVGPDELRDLEAKRDDLLAKREQLKSSPRRRGN